ncbi:amino acid adenylation domain-containing protein [Pseudomonas palleroniana]
MHSSVDKPATNSAETSSSSIEDLFTRIAAQTPEAIAISDRGRQVSYGTLCDCAWTLSKQLVDAGVGAGDFVALSLERGTDMICAMLATLMAGAAYIPVDPRYPSERRAFILDDSHAVALIKDSDESGKKGPRIDLIERTVERQAATSTHGRIAYVIYTSGSTGKPKGVMVTHHNVLRLFRSTADFFEFSSSDVWCGFHSPSFDFSVWEIWGALLHGGRHVIVPVETAKDPQQFAKLLFEQAVSVLNQTPSAFRNLIPSLVEQGIGADLRYVIFGGEKLDVAALRPWASKFGMDRPALINMYGITETTVHVTHKRLAPGELEQSDQSPVGTPLSDMQIRVVSASGETLSAGSAGVMHVGGEGVSAGYLRRELLTAERFYEAPDAEGVMRRWYDSGDIGMQLENGEFVCLGRADKQLKIRGFRIEPGEIESLLRNDPDVIDCVVSAADFASDDRRLIACIVVPQASLQSRDQILRRLKSLTESSLPTHMCPSRYFLGTEFLMTANGKLDIDAYVHQPQQHSPTSSEASVHELVRNVWAQLLKSESFTNDDEFFDQGGTSFTLIKMLQTINLIFDTHVRPDALSEGITVSRLAGLIHKQRQSKTA